MALNYKVYGEGEPVIILHGLFGMLDNWQTVAKKLAEKYMVYLIDQRDHGKSPHTEAFNYSLLAEDLYQFMTDNWLYEARLIGHSMGGKTVMKFAQEYDDMVEQMVVVDIAPGAYKRGHEAIFEALLAVDTENVSSRNEVDAILEEYISEQGIRQFLMKNLKRRKEGGYRWKMNLDLLHREYDNIIASVAIDENTEVDTLFIKGERSLYIDADASKYINKHYSNVNIVEIKDSGHWVHAEKPKELLDTINDFFGAKE